MEKIWSVTHLSLVVTAAKKLDWTATAEATAVSTLRRCKGDVPTHVLEHVPRKLALVGCTYPERRTPPVQDREIVRPRTL